MMEHLTVSDIARKGGQSRSPKKVEAARANMLRYWERVRAGELTRGKQRKDGRND
jgi:hypothetical protein